MSEWVPQHGDFVQTLDGKSNVHIVATQLLAAPHTVVTVCGLAWPLQLLKPSDAENPRQCSKCWASM